MEPRDATVTVHRTREVPYKMSFDGITPLYKTVCEDERVPARVWPVSMGEHEMLVELESGRLIVAKIWDIELVVNQ